MPPISTKPELVAQAILEEIASGHRQPGERMPSEQALAKRFGVSVETLRRALAQLADDGLIVKRPRVGNFIAERTRPTTHSSYEIAAIFPSYLMSAENQMPPVTLWMSGISKGLGDEGYRLGTYFYDGPSFEQQVIPALLDHGVDGALLAAHRLVTAKHIETLRAAGVEVVLITGHSHLKDLGISTFQLSNESSLLQILDGLFDRGHREIVVARYRYPNASQRNTDILQAFGRRVGMQDPEQLCISLENASTTVDFSVLDRVLDRDCPPSAIVVPDEITAGAVFRRCYQRGIRIPDDLSLAAISDSLPKVHPVPLTAPDTVGHISWMGQAATSHLRERLESSLSVPTVQTSVYGDVCWRASVTQGPHAAAQDEHQPDDQVQAAHSLR